MCGAQGESNEGGEAEGEAEAEAEEAPGPAEGAAEDVGEGLRGTPVGGACVAS